MKNILEIDKMSDEELDCHITQLLSLYDISLFNSIKYLDLDSRHTLLLKEHYRFDMSGLNFKHNQEILKKFQHLGIFNIIILFHKGHCKIKLFMYDSKKTVTIDLGSGKGTIEIIRILIRIMLFEGSFSNKKHPINKYKFDIVDNF